MGRVNHIAQDSKMALLYARQQDDMMGESLFIQSNGWQDTCKKYISCYLVLGMTMDNGNSWQGSGLSIVRVYHWQYILGGRLSIIHV
ncbi:predicted protein [Lichtheimia corymbifera JMRC:FSU:9682]|uniref:Uncharacterized protein n=1 Tax=Lichtheimia corymbifera JMRC:FSU:9682 TaxID=1263082 RepID=A0A068RIG8_9FUNG|nr:predicted protein [Lichtheimia corymbifera JMRC:FSU:9682]